MPDIALVRQAMAGTMAGDDKEIPMSRLTVWADSDPTTPVLDTSDAA